MKFVVWWKSASCVDCCAAAIWTKYLLESNDDILALSLWKIDKQTAYLFEKAQVPVPYVQTDLEAGSELTLVNHSRRAESIDELDEYVVAEVINNWTVDLGLSYACSIRTEPVASVCTVIAEIFIDKVYIPEVNYLILLMAWIVVDTENFTSPETTERDEEAFHWLKEMVTIEDRDSFVVELLEKWS